MAIHGKNYKLMMKFECKHRQSLGAFLYSMFAERVHSVNLSSSHSQLPKGSQVLTMPFGQLVIGPPGAGKSTYCDGMHQLLSAIGRKCAVVNLDPANDHTSYPCALDVRSLITLEEIMKDDELGPNGAVLYALEELENNWEWLEEGLKEVGGMLTLYEGGGRGTCTEGVLTSLCRGLRAL